MAHRHSAINSLSDWRTATVSSLYSPGGSTHTVDRASCHLSTCRLQWRQGVIQR